MKVNFQLIFSFILLTTSIRGQADVFTFGGLSRTRESWIREYLAIDENHRYSPFELEQLKKHLLTTGAFTKVDIRVLNETNFGADEKTTSSQTCSGALEDKTSENKATENQTVENKTSENKTSENKTSENKAVELKPADKTINQTPLNEKTDERQICIFIEEKWTTIPVVRGEFGGGTPLRVLGIYDIHTFGSLITTGAEFRKYGISDPGFVAWAKAPRFKDGRYSLGAELWKDIRMRTVYDRERVSLGEFEERSSRLRLFYFHPLNSNGLRPTPSHEASGELSQSDQEKNKKLSSLGTHQAGFDFHIYKQSPTSFKPSYLGAAAPFTFDTKPHLGARLFISAIFDNITVDQYDYEGLRNILRLGVDLDGKFVSEMQTFGYKLLGDINLASHFSLHNHSGTDIAEQRFLGGFDGIRGMMDGAQVGPKSWQWNNEAKFNFLRTPHVWLMLAGFYDTGRAGSHLEISDRISSAGVGVRIASPKIYRLMLRIDHGWAVDGSKQKGFSIGLNDFFQPYRPL